MDYIYRYVQLLAPIVALLLLIVLESDLLIVDLLILLNIGSLLFARRLRYSSPAFAIAIPWLFITLTTYLPITEYHRELQRLTEELIRIPILVGLISVPLLRYRRANISVRMSISSTYPHILFLIYAFLLLTNIIYSGYVPLISGLLTGDTRYITFGVPSVTGFSWAYANAVGVFLFFLFLKTNRRIYLIYYLLVLFGFILCITRQNIFSLLVETLIVYTIYRGYVARLKLILTVFIASFAFQIVGEFRSSDITELVGLKKEYEQIPSAFIWIYSYSFFNMLNMENMIQSVGEPKFDGSSLDRLIPSFLLEQKRARVFDYLEILNFNVSSYIGAVYNDIGFSGYLIFTISMVGISVWLYNQLLRSGYKFVYVGIYSVFFFCSIFSFFTNFWLYLPVIFQVIFFFGFQFLYKETYVHKERE